MIKAHPIERRMLSEVGVDEKLTASRLPTSGGGMGRSWAKESGAETLAIIYWRWHAKALPDQVEQRLGWDGSAGGLGLVLVDALHHAAFHMQGVVEQLALAVGGVLDQLGEQCLLAGRLTRAD
jgi:hypothetical protein